MDPLSSLLPTNLIGSISLGTVLVLYLTWLLNVPTLEDQRKAIQEAVVGKEFSSDFDSYTVEQIDYLEENNSFEYRISKLIPRIRTIDGSTTVTVAPNAYSMRGYVWKTEDVGEDFPRYLEEVYDRDAPHVELVQPDFSQESSDAVTELRLKIDTVDPDQISKILEQIPNFIDYYYSNYPGDSRYRLPY